MAAASANTSLTAAYKMSSIETLPERLRQIRRTIREEYLESHEKPWIVGFSGGKDSTLLLQLVIESILTISPEQRTRRIFVLSNDTLVESPVYQSQVLKSLKVIEEGMVALGLPVEVVLTHPEEDSTFWVNLLGRGYPAPNRNFRWCTDRMKIRPTTLFIREKAAANGEVILLLGVRKAESIARAQRIDSYSANEGERRLNPHNDVKGCLIFRPIVNLSNDDVWHILLNVRAPWGGNHRELVTLYRNAKGGECPFVVSDEDAPSCGSCFCPLRLLDLHRRRQGQLDRRSDRCRFRVSGAALALPGAHQGRVQHSRVS